MTKTTIICIELGMLGGIAGAFYALPSSTPLRTFLIASGLLFVLGNAALINKLKESKPAQQAPNSEAWSHIWSAFAILAVGWLVALLFSRH